MTTEDVSQSPCHKVGSDGGYMVVYNVSQKKLCKIVLSELLQISTNFDSFWQKDGKDAKIM